MGRVSFILKNVFIIYYRCYFKRGGLGGEGKKLRRVAGSAGNYLMVWNSESMTDEMKELLVVAREACELAYAPYSRYHVGAAVLTEKGVFKGANIENASSNLGICAERVAIGHARMNGATEIKIVAVCCRDAEMRDGVVVNRSETMPCGGCRQWLFELAPDAFVVSNGTDEVMTTRGLFPNGFTLRDSL